MFPNLTKAVPKNGRVPSFQEQLGEFAAEYMTRKLNLETLDGVVKAGFYKLVTDRDCYIDDHIGHSALLLHLANGLHLEDTGTTLIDNAITADHKKLVPFCVQFSEAFHRDNFNAAEPVVFSRIVDAINLMLPFYENFSPSGSVMYSEMERRNEAAGKQYVHEDPLECLDILRVAITKARSEAKGHTT